MEDIVAEGNGEIVALLVNSVQTRDTRSRVDQLIKKYSESYAYESSLPYLFGDSVFQRLFPHNALPHIVWISKEGRLVANTYPSALTVENINAVLKNGTALLHQKKLKVDAEESLLADNMLYGGSVFKTYQEGLTSVYDKYSYDGNQTRFQILNQSFSLLLAMAFGQELKGIPWRHWVFDSNVKTKRDLLIYDSYDNRFCYEMMVRDSVSRAVAMQIFTDDFKRFFGLTISVEDGPTDVWNIKLNRNIEKIKTKGHIPEVFIGDARTEMRFRNIPLELLINNLSLYFAKPLVLKTQGEPQIDCNIPRDFDAWDENRKRSFLQTIGLDLEPAHRSIRYARFSSNR